MMNVRLQVIPNKGLFAHCIPKLSPKPIESSFVLSTELVENEESNHVITSMISSHELSREDIPQKVQQVAGVGKNGILDDTSEKLNADDKYAEPTKNEPNAAASHIGGSRETHSNTFSKRLTFLDWIKSW